VRVQVRVKKTKVFLEKSFSLLIIVTLWEHRYTLQLKSRHGRLTRLQHKVTFATANMLLKAFPSDD
jgi:hypothetical protein